MPTNLTYLVVRREARRQFRSSPAGLVIRGRISLWRVPMASKPMRSLLALVVCVNLVTMQSSSADAQGPDWRARVQEVADSLKNRDPRVTGAPKHWKPARTPWGDPDLTGIYTNSEEYFTPLERPAEFEGRKLEDITPTELEKIQEARRSAIIQRFGSNPPPEPGTIGWYEIWNARSSRPWLVIDPPDGQIPPLTTEARQRTQSPPAARHPYARYSLALRCITLGLPGSMTPKADGNAYQIHQSPGYVAIRYEKFHETRVIPVGDRPHVGPAIQMYMGDARGRWDEDTLVVETTRFKDARAEESAEGIVRRIIERFTPVSPEALLWSVTLDEPATWTRAWTFAMNLTRTHQSQQPYEFACHEGNYALRNIISMEAAGAARGR